MIKQIILPVLLLASVTAAAEDLFLREYTVRSGADFVQAVATINGSPEAGTYRIILAANIQVGDVDFTASDTKKTVVIQGDTTVRNIVNTATADMNLFTVNKGITLSLENNLRLDGNGKEDRTVLVDGGDLVIKAGSCIEGSKGGAVCVIEDGVVTMSGGEIRGNEGGSGACDSKFGPKNVV
jgi:hypothetical protein